MVPEPRGQRQLERRAAEPATLVSAMRGAKRGAVRAGVDGCKAARQGTDEAWAGTCQQCLLQFVEILGAQVGA